MIDQIIEGEPPTEMIDLYLSLSLSLYIYIYFIYIYI